MRKSVRFDQSRYSNDLLSGGPGIHEGIADEDSPGVPDDARIEYLDAHLADALRR